jgi:selenocysteine lyase/cysteine desulfurase
MDRQRSSSEFVSSGGVGTISADSVDWREVRSHFVLRDDMIYMNSGTEGSMPRRVLERYADYNSDWAKSPSYYFFDNRKLGTRDFQRENRQAIGQFVGADGADICLTNNTTMGLAMALLGLPLQPGDEVLTSDQEHWSLIASLAFLEKRRIKTRYVPIEVPLKHGRSVVEAFKSRISKRTKVIAVSHISWSTGARLPVERLCRLAREKGVVTVIDGAHALGALSLDLPELGCDFYATSGHKWLNGPPGTGVLYIREAGLNPCKLDTIIAEKIPNIDKEPITTQLQIRGCNNTPSFAGMIDSAAFADDLGRDVIEQRILDLSTHAKRRVIEAWGSGALVSPGPDARDLCSGMTSFVPSSDKAAAFKQDFINKVVKLLWTESRIYVRSVPIPTSTQPGTRFVIRVSTHIFNTYSDIDRLIAETRRIAETLAPSGRRRVSQASS